MNSLENLPEISEHVLSGLKADSGLKHRILLSASSAPAVRKYSFKTVVALCSPNDYNISDIFFFGGKKRFVLFVIIDG